MTIEPTVTLPATTTAQRPRVSIVIPCLNEAENIEECVARAFAALADDDCPGEVIVVDNASEDDSGKLARLAGATVISEPRRGYGSAYLAGFAAATGDYIVMIDADLTYDFAEIPRFVHELDKGAQLVMGNRLEGVQPGAMSRLSRVGNPLLSGFMNVVYRTPVGDAHCGLRAFRRDCLPLLDLQSTGMELASEMVIRATRQNLEIRELPIALHPRAGESKLSPFRDGWRHLRLMLIYNPTFLFILPGAVMAALGSLLTVLVFAQVNFFGRPWFVHTLIAGSALLIVGTQVLALGLCGRLYGVWYLGERSEFLERFQGRIRLEHALAFGAVVVLVGLALGGAVLARWAGRGFGSLGEERVAILAVTLVVVGMQVIFTAFLLSILGLRRNPRR